jgi:hypothetical protein
MHKDITIMISKMLKETWAFFVLKEFSLGVEKWLVGNKKWGVWFVREKYYI